MVADRERSLEDIEEMKKDFQALKAEMEASKEIEADLEEDVEYMNQSIEVLLEELNQVKSESDLTIKKNIKIDALLTWVGQFLPEMAEEDDFDDEEFDDEELDDEEFEENEETKL